MCAFFVLKLNQITIKNLALISFAVFLFSATHAGAQWHQLYNELCIYQVAHQDDWQLFMGSNVYNDIVNYNEKNPDQNGKKVVIIYTTAGNLHDDDDSKSCNCRDPYDPKHDHIAYWKVREQGAKNSVHLAATRMGGWGCTGPYRHHDTAVINGHVISRYVFKNTTSYFLRLKAGMYGRWMADKTASVGTVDSSTTYTDWADFVSTLYYIYKTEADSSVANGKISFNFQDIDTLVNPNDHNDHMIAGRAGCEAARLLSSDMGTCLPESLFTDYHSQNLPPNLNTPDVQNEAALTGVYCMALLEYNAWPEWGKIYQDWTCRNYFRTITTCQEPARDSILTEDSLGALTVKAYPTPANQSLYLQFNRPVKPPTQLRVMNINGMQVLQADTMSSENTLMVNTSSLPNGSYMMVIGSNNTRVASVYFEVLH